jgi:hypothetical protein
MDVPLLNTRLERIDSMPESPTGTDGDGPSGVFVISDEDEVHGGHNFHTPGKSKPAEGEWFEDQL